MKYKFPLVLIGFVALFSANLYSQTDSTVQRTPPKIEADYIDAPEYYSVGPVRGNIGEARAVILKKPIFTQEAKESGAEGFVRVEIIVSKDGNVTSAKAISGHEALAEAAEAAALKSKFSTSKIPQKAENYRAFLTYEFIVKKPNWFKVGYDLALAKKLPTIHLLQPELLAKAFEANWKTENQLILQLLEIKRNSPEPSKPALMTRFERSAPNTNSQTVEGSYKLDIPTKNPEEISISENLISQLRGRLGNDPQKLWQFNLGVSLIEFQTLYRNPATRAEGLELIKNNIQNAPSGIPNEMLEEVRKFVNIIDQPRTIETGTEIRQIIANLQKFG